MKTVASSTLLTKDEKFEKKLQMRCGKLLHDVHHNKIVTSTVQVNIHNNIIMYNYYAFAVVGNLLINVSLILFKSLVWPKKQSTW